MSAKTNIPPFIDAGGLSLLKGRQVYLTFLNEAHREILRPLARDERIWEFTKTLMITDTYDQQFDKYFNEAIATAASGGQTFVIVGVGGITGDAGRMTGVEGGKVGGGRAGEDRVIGMTRVYDVDWKVRKVTIGHTWYIPAVWGKVHNKECKLLLLQYIFGRLGFVRVEFKVASQNLRSQKAVARIGGVKEAILRKYTLRNDGTPSDTVIFSILDEEWPEKKEQLLQLVAGAEA
jgi:RimJ/RimL family protein N-acetyltransferase